MATRDENDTQHFYSRVHAPTFKCDQPFRLRMSVIQGKLRTSMADENTDLGRGGPTDLTIEEAEDIIMFMERAVARLKAGK